MNTYAETAWTPGDVQSLRPDWTLEECEDWLMENGKYLMDEIITRGWDILENLLPPRNDIEEELK